MRICVCLCVCVRVYIYLSAFLEAKRMFHRNARGTNRFPPVVMSPARVSSCQHRGPVTVQDIKEGKHMRKVTGMSRVYCVASVRNGSYNFRIFLTLCEYL
jgi:hypothetical protein